jgi:outer membrane lipoprotein-sorting protein
MQPRLFLLTCFAFICWLNFPTTHVFAQKDPKAKAILDAMSKKYKSLPHFKATVSVEQLNTLDNTKSTFKGEAKVKGQKYHLKTEEQEIFNDGQSVWTYLKAENEVTITSFEPDPNEMNINNFHTMYEKDFKYTWLEQVKEGGKTYDIIDLIPENIKSSYFKIRITIESSTKELKNWKIFEKNGRQYTYSVTQFDTNTKITDADFVFDEKKFPKIEVVDLR